MRVGQKYAFFSLSRTLRISEQLLKAAEIKGNYFIGTSEIFLTVPLHPHISGWQLPAPPSLVMYLKMRYGINTHHGANGEVHKQPNAAALKGLKEILTLKPNKVT